MSRLEIWYPVRPFHVNQHFGDNIPCVKDFGEVNQVIVDGTQTTCPVGFDKLYGHFGMDGHNGTDLMAGVQDVFAACAGTVIEQQTVPARGLGLGILTDSPVEMDCGIHFAKVRYWHLKSFSAKVGDHVEIGQKIGVSDNTGYSSANHLHFELQPMDKDAGGHPFLVNPDGHIAGAVSIEPYFNGYYATDAPKILSTYQKIIALLKGYLGSITKK